jgi:DNA-binding MarR family transcriptional regulator
MHELRAISHSDRKSDQVDARAARMASVSSLLRMDRTTLTAALKPLERRGLVKVATDPSAVDPHPGGQGSSLLRCPSVSEPIWK